MTGIKPGPDLEAPPTLLAVSCNVPLQGGVCQSWFCASKTCSWMHFLTMHTPQAGYWHAVTLTRDPALLYRHAAFTLGTLSQAAPNSVLPHLGSLLQARSCSCHARQLQPCSGCADI